MTTRQSVLYGLLGLTHGGARILTLLARHADAQWFEHLAVSEEDFRIVPGADVTQPVQLHERKDGAIGRLIRQHRVSVLDNAAWMKMKQRRSSEYRE